jgi:hypothetical protein
MDLSSRIGIRVINENIAPPKQGAQQQYAFSRIFLQARG